MAKGEDAHDAALRALARRDLTARELDQRLHARGFAAPEREQVLETLARTGLVDDSRYAYERAAQLAARGAGNTLIRHALEQAGLAREEVDGAVEALDSEQARAERVVQRRGRGPRTARYLRGKGFAEDVVSAVAAGGDDGVG